MEQDKDIQILDDLYSDWVEDLSNYRNLRAKEHVDKVKLKRAFGELLSSSDRFACFTKRFAELKLMEIDTNNDKLNLTTRQRGIILDLSERVEGVLSEGLTVREKFLLNTTINDSEKDVVVKMIVHSTDMIYILLKLAEI